MSLGGPDQHGVMVQVIRRFRSSPAGSTTSRSTGWVVSLPLTRKLPREELVDYAEGPGHASSTRSGRDPHGCPPFDQCAGYRVPLFLGGDDAVANLEQSDIGVYWSLMGQPEAESPGSSTWPADLGNRTGVTRGRAVGVCGGVGREVSGVVGVGWRLGWSGRVLIVTSLRCGSTSRELVGWFG